MKFFSIFLLIGIASITLFTGLNPINAQKNFTQGNINNTQTNATNDYYNEYYINNLLSINQSTSKNVSIPNKSVENRYIQ